MDSIIFDLDGTLWDSSEQIASAWNKSLNNNFPEVEKTITQKDVAGILGMVTEEIAQTLFGDDYPERALEITEKLCEEECMYLRETGGILYDDLEDTLEILAKQYPLFIISNCQSGYIEAFLEYHGLERYFKGFLCSGQTGKRKGENIRMLMKEYHLKNPVYIGDTDMDYEATKIAQIPFIHAAYGFGKPKGTFQKICAIGELPELLKI